MQEMLTAVLIKSRFVLSRVDLQHLSIKDNIFAVVTTRPKVNSMGSERNEMAH